MPRTDTDWIAGLKAGDDAVFRDLRIRLLGAIHKGFGRQLPEGMAEDLAHDAVLRIRDRLDTFEGRSRFTTWATAIAVNQSLQALRRQKFAHVSMEEAIQSSSERFAHAPDDERPDALRARTLLRQGVDEVLTERQREAILAELGGLPLMVIAERMGSSRGAMYKLLHDARRKLRAWLEARGVDSASMGAT